MTRVENAIFCEFWVKVEPERCRASCSVLEAILKVFVVVYRGRWEVVGRFEKYRNNLDMKRARENDGRDEHGILGAEAEDGGEGWTADGVGEDGMGTRELRRIWREEELRYRVIQSFNSR